MHTIQKGDLSVAMIIAAFLKKRITVLRPLSELHRYDLVIDRGLGFERIQCKTGSLRSGVIRFKTCSTTSHHKNARSARQSYKGQIEHFAVYCPDNDTCYLIPIDEVSDTEASLRVELPKNKQKSGIRLASDYVL